MSANPEHMINELAELDLEHYKLECAKKEIGEKYDPVRSSYTPHWYKVTLEVLEERQDRIKTLRLDLLKSIQETIQVATIKQAIGDSTQ